MPTRIRIPQRIIEHITVPIETLRIGRVGHNRIRADETPQPRHVVARLVIVQPQGAIVALPGVAAIGGRVAVARFAVGPVAQLANACAARVGRQTRRAAGR